MSEMETNNPQESSIDTSSVDTSSALEVSSAPEITDSAPVDTGSSAPAEPAYQPNFKFKAAGKEYELDEEYRPYVKSPEDEKRIKRIFEQAKALDPVREEKEKYRSERDTYESELRQFHSGLETIKQFRAKGDVRRALMTLGLTPQEILQAAKQELDFDALPQQAKDSYYQSQEYERQNQQLSQVNQTYASQMAQLQTEVRRTQLSTALSAPETKDFQTWFDSVNGEGSFRNRVIQTGDMQWRATGQDIGVEQAVAMVMGEFKAYRQQTQSTQLAQPQVNQTPQAPRQVPVIPSAKSAAQAAPQTAIRSTKDLERAYEEVMARKGRIS